MINKILTRFAGRQTDADDFSYEAAARRACETEAGAQAFRVRLTQIAASLESPRGRRLAQRQAELAEVLAVAARVQSDLQNRIPEVLQRDEADQQGALAEAESAVEAARSHLAECEVKHGKVLTVLDELETKLSAAVRADDGAVENARSAMLAAHQQGDEAAVAAAEAQFSKAYAARADREHTVAVDVERVSVQRDVAQKFGDELARARAALVEAEERHAVCQFQLDAIQSDRAMLGALVAYTKAIASATLAPRGRSPSIPGETLFRFYRLERAPLWDGKALAGAVDHHTMRRLRDALTAPDWRVFAVDPASLPAESQEQSTSAISA